MPAGGMDYGALNGCRISPVHRSGEQGENEAQERPEWWFYTGLAVRRLTQDPHTEMQRP
jgi:hypothetical protein